MTPALLDTSVIVALLDRTDHFHQRCSEAIATVGRRLVTCEAVIAEACYLLRRVHGASEAVVENVAKGTFRIEMQLSDCAADVQGILRKYRDTRIDLADACLVHLASKSDTGDILTLDRDFEIYRWRGNRPFHFLVPLR